MTLVEAVRMVLVRAPFTLGARQRLISFLSSRQTSLAERHVMTDEASPVCSHKGETLRGA